MAMTAMTTRAVRGSRATRRDTGRAARARRAPGRWAWVAAVGLLCAAGAGCGAESDDGGDDRGDDGGGADEIVADPFPSTVELSAGDLDSLAPDAGDGALVFSPAPASLESVKVGSILVGGVSSSSPSGLLRAVLAVERDGDQLTLRTAQAPIQLAYRTLHVRFDRSSAVPAISGLARRAGPRPAEDGFHDTSPFNYLLFDGDGDEETTNDQIAIDGSIGGGFDYEFALDVSWGAIADLPDVVTSCLESIGKILDGEPPSCSIDDLLPEARASFIVYPELHADANVHGAAILEYEKEVDLASTTLAPIVIGPLVFVPAVDLTAQLEGAASASFTTGVHGSATFQTSVYLSSRHPDSPQLEMPVLRSSDIGPNDTHVSLHARAKVGAGARLNLLLYGVTGPYATARTYAAIDADILQSPCWKLHAGVDMDLGIKVTSPALPLLGHVTLVDWHTPALNAFDVELSTGDCEAPPDTSTLPPGSGPDPMSYASPPYTPWSRTFSSPVEGSQAASPNNSVAFSDLQRTIDGHYVRAGYGVKTLAKFDEAGREVWARDLALTDGEPLRPLRMRPTADAAMMVVSSAVTAPIVMTRLAQDGSVISARAFDVPLDVCQVDVSSLSSDGAGGHYVAGGCIGQPASFLLHAAGDDATFWLLDAGDIAAFRVRVAENVGGDAFLSGTLSDGTDAMFAVMLRPDGTVRYGKRYRGCEAAADAIPSQAIAGARGEVTIAGSGGAQHNGVVLRLHPDGTVGFAAFPGFGFGAGSVFLLDSIAELPTTGYVVGGSTVRFSDEEETAGVPSAALLGLDGAGRILWANRYTFGAPGSREVSGQVGVHLTDDGGAMATALVGDSADPLGGHLWAFKPYAKDGAISFAPGGATRTPLDVAELECAMTDADLAVAVAPRSIASRPVTVTSTGADLGVAAQTAD
jgi:hypothetical protein